MRRKELSYYIEGVLDGDTVILSQSITLIESKLQSDNGLAGEIIDSIIEHTGKSIRIGISGVPGVGKSTFIESFGNFLTAHGKRVAVLAIDPSSKLTGGSILGDKTRMDLLGRDPNAFIRPSPTGETLGGVAERTRESILLCEAAGFDVILVETVGVGQSEVMAASMVDFFLLLMLAGAGDELQGIKKGIMEMVDGMVINKADGDNKNAANRARSEYKNALHLFPPAQSGWIPEVSVCSALEKTGLEGIWDMISRFHDEVTGNGFLTQNRRDQNLEWFRQQVSFLLMNQYLNRTDVSELKEALEAEIKSGTKDSKTAATELLALIFDR